MPTVGRPSGDQSNAHAARQAAAILNATPSAAALQSALILPLPAAHASPIAPHVVAKFTAWLQEDNHPHRALCQEDSEASPRPLRITVVTSLFNLCALTLSVAHPKTLASPVPPS